MLDVRVAGLEKAQRQLERIRRQAIPHAMRDALNGSAFLARQRWQEEIRQSFTTRNKFTERSVLVEKARGTSSDMFAVVGSVAPYMGDQEHGARIRGGGKHKAIPGPVAAGQAAGSKRTRVVRRARRLSAISVQRPSGIGPRKQANAVTIRHAKAAGRRFVLLERPGGGRGLYLLGGGKRKTTTRLLWDMSRGSVRVDPEPTLQRTLRAIESELPKVHTRAILRQLKRVRISGG